MRKFIEKHMPYPMAAPETRQLRSARRRLIGALVAVAILTWLWPLAVSVSKLGAAALFAGLGAFVLVQGLFWARAKNAADDAYLFSGDGCDDDA
ncbi:hypothetical protein B2G71_19440 [Novosphingobium sp. PC22D]|jgi:uncharacterized membrane protein YfbV (UPF0208 family)|uniref:DUF3329 domain-containing protein n=2 Tax=Novosphingobium TaxID=165696 RepID=A0ABQ2JU44_9SPHN|nr:MULTISPECIES: hypothetical protein [Novosphingobium]MCJ2180102.1 hypothetical protein [Novosphingobium album (ex Hu et al. 2023)]PEQ10992.1 hypothetical protein B2G71_19440 [Novosphingobium sp. PC22D]GGN55381.1 hypothetical protein GCM10011349_31970 [Novosphingobium indicum]